MAREYVPLPLEYLEEMALLTDGDFGKLVRALLLYAKDGTPVDLEGDCRFYCTRVMNKDKHYAERAAEEEEKRERVSRRNSRNARARYKTGDETAVACDGMQPHAMAGNTIPNQTIPNQSKPYQSKPDQSNGDSAEPEMLSAAAPAVPLVDGTEYAIKVKELEEWKKAFPAVNVEQELREMRAWCLANPTMRKTRRGVHRFINAWLSREQDKGHPGQAAKAAPAERRFVPSEF